MINLQEFYTEFSDRIAGLLEGINPDLDFEVSPQIGEFKYQPKQGKIHRPNNPIISGVLIARSDDLVPIEGYDVFTFTSLLNLTVYKELVQEVFNDISEFVSNYNGKTLAYNEEQDLLLTFDTPTVSNLDQKAAAGTSAEIRLYITAVLYGSGVMGNDISTFITHNGKAEKLDVLQGAWQLAKTNDSDNVGNDEYVRNVPTSQNLTLTLKVAYRKTPVLKQIVKDIHSGALKKEYTITYYDSAIDESFTHVMTLTQGTLSFTPGVVSALDLVFNRR